MLDVMRSSKTLHNFPYFWNYENMSTVSYEICCHRAEGIHWILYSKNAAALGHFIKHKSLFSEEYHISFLLAACDPWFEDFH